MESDIKATILGLISISVSLIAIFFEEYRNMIMISYAIALVGYFLFTYLSRIEEIEKKLNGLEKSFKRSGDLIKIKADIESLKRDKI
jgi:hypothetical protein